MKKIILEETEYELIKDYKNGFDLEELTKRYTDYFKEYDYIFGDWAYGKLRLKGFCKKENSLINDINNYNKIETYIKNDCAYDCKHFIIEKKL
ncbi:MAG: YutD-like domain-containing protein [Bacilli bacterium]